MAFVICFDENIGEVKYLCQTLSVVIVILVFIMANNFSCLCVAFILFPIGILSGKSFFEVGYSTLPILGHRYLNEGRTIGLPHQLNFFRSFELPYDVCHTALAQLLQFGDLLGLKKFS